jgi:uncharacterized protein YfcZ (UPF0381/DUF406 family)
MKVKELMSNPSGTKTGYLYSREKIIADLDRSYNELKNKGKKFRWKVYKNAKETNKVIHIQVPSESIENFWFDVIIDIIGYPQNSKSFNDADVLIFCNSPSWIFFYAFVAHENGLTPTWLIPKIAKQALKEAPKQTNPVNTLGFEKMTSYALRFIIENDLYNDVISRPTVLNKKEILKVIDNSDDILEKYTLFKKKATEAKKKEKAREKAEKVKSAPKPKSSAKTVSKVKKANSATKKANVKVKSTTRKRN